MKKSILTAVAILGVVILSGCASQPRHANLTGAWNYTFEESGKSVTQTGSMTIAQNQYDLSGKAIDAFGEFSLSGLIDANSSKFILNGMRNDNKRTFKMDAVLSDENTFSGTYITDQNTSGSIKGSRLNAAK